MPDSNDLTFIQRIFRHIPERIVLAAISVLTLIAFGLTDYIVEWLPDSPFVTFAYVALFALILLHLTIPLPKLWRIVTRKTHRTDDHTGTTGGLFDLDDLK